MANKMRHWTTIRGNKETFRNHQTILSLKLIVSCVNMLQ